ncbi:MAG TPA: kelch repeat-containing protein [Puia sp.]|nr:kelch repeat-containing protein [Puia sp.]
MKRFHIFLSAITVLIVTLSSCSKSSVNPTQDGNWVYVGDFGGTSRTEAISFVIGDKAYIGTGIDQLTTRYSDLWSFDPTSNSWYQVATAPADFTPRNSAVAFAVAGMGYVGSGTDGYNYFSDFWQYDPTGNSWKKVASLGDANNGLTPRYNAVAFGLDKYGYGYVGTGNDGRGNQLNDFWQYDPTADKWTELPTYPGFKREQAVAFTHSDKGYLVTGLGTGGAPVNDFVVLDPSNTTNPWSTLRHISNYSPDSYDDGYTSIIRYNAVGFVMTGTTSDGGGDRAYITTGSAGSTTWAYNFATDLWNQKTSYERASRTGAVGFTVQNRGFVGLGGSGSTPFANIDEWKPDETYNQQD